MTRRERLMATLRGQPVDRPAVNFYELTAWKHHPDDPDAFNVYNDPSWAELLELAENQTDIIRTGAPLMQPASPLFSAEFSSEQKWQEGESRFTRTTVNAAGRTLTQLTRRDAAVDTVWVLEHLLKDADDVRAFLELPDSLFQQSVDCSNMFNLESELGDAGIVMMDTADPICAAAGNFSMEDYTILALTEQELFHQLLAKFARHMHRTTEIIAREFPGRLWRIYGPEYASEPYLPPRLFAEYVVTYTGPMIKSIQKYGGFARIHCHGRLRNIMPHIAAMKPDGMDPIEPPPQGDMELIEVRRNYGKDMVLFGNIEIADIENLPEKDFAVKVDKALREGPGGRGFVLMPSASPYGRTVTPRTLANYKTMIRLANK